MRSQHVIIGVVSLVLAGCARLVPPDSIVALEVGPQQVNVMVGKKAPLRMVGTRGDGRTVNLSARDVRFASSDSSVARVTRDGAVQGLRLGRASISATLSTPNGPVSVNGITVAVGKLVAESSDRARRMTTAASPVYRRGRSASCPSLFPILAPHMPLCTGPGGCCTN